MFRYLNGVKKTLKTNNKIHITTLIRAGQPGIPCQTSDSNHVI
jgi:hypothetical protein